MKTSLQIIPTVLSPVGLFPKIYPHFRSTIHWNPSVQVNDSGNIEYEFFLSDDVGEMLFYLEGITEDGIPFSIKKDISVEAGL